MGRRSQASMEYLNTYGIAALVAAVVIFALYQLGVFGGLNSSQNVCIPSSGFSCSVPIMSASGILNSTIGQLTQTITVIATACTLNATLTGATFNTISSTSLTSGQKTGLSFHCPLLSSNAPIGTQFSGYLWIKYNQNNGGTQNVVQAVGQVKATVKMPASSSTTTTSSTTSSTSTISFTVGSDKLAVTCGVGTGYQGYGGWVSGSPCSTTLTIPGQTYPLYLCGAADGIEYNGGFSSTSYTLDNYDVNKYATVGHQGSNGCAAVYTDEDLIVGGIGVGNSVYTLYTGSASVQYTVSTPNALVIILASCGYAACSAHLPLFPHDPLSTCTEASTFTGPDNQESFYIATCLSSAPGTYTATLNPQANSHTAMAAYVFPN